MRLAALWYVLASVALVVQAGSCRLLEGVWGLGGSAVPRLLLVAFGQAAAVALARHLNRPRQASGGEPEQLSQRRASSRSALGSFLTLWLLLVVVHAVLGGAVSVLLLRHLDLRFVAFLQLLVVPTVQAVMVPWVEARWSVADLGRGLGVAARDRVAALLLSCATGAIVVPWFFAGRTGRILGDVRLLWAGAAAIAAGVVLAIAVTRDSWTRGQRLALGGLAGWMITLGLDPFTSWIAGLTGLLPERWPMVLSWAAVGGSMAVATLAFLVAGSVTVRSRSTSSGAFIDGAGGALFAVALVAVLSTFLRRYPTPFWSGVLTSGLAVAGTLVLVGSVLLMRRGGDAV